MTPNRLIAPKLNPIAGLPEFQIEQLQLDNNIPVKYINVGSQKLIKLQILFPAGIAEQNKSLQAYLTGKMLKEGSDKYSASKLAEIIDFYGAFLDIKITRDHAIIHLISLNKHLDKILQIIVDFLTRPLFPEKEFNVMKEREKQAFLYRIQKVKTLAQREFNKEIFGEKHAYGSQADLNDFDLITREDLQTFFNNHYDITKAKIFIGGFADQEVLKTLNSQLGKLSITHKNNKKNIVEIDNIPPNEVLVKKDDAMQTALRFGKLCPDRKSDDFPAFALTNNILGGFFGSRLMQNIREDKGYTYGIYSNIQHLKHASIFSIASEVGSNVSLKAIEEIDKELKSLKTDLVKDEELELVKNYMSGSLLRSLNGPFALGEMIKTIEEFELEPQYYQNFLNAIHQTSSEEVQRIAKQYLQEDSLTRVRVGL